LKRVIQSAINLSTSESSLVEKIVKEISDIPGLKIADYSSDPDHNRSGNPPRRRRKFRESCT